MLWLAFGSSEVNPKVRNGTRQVDPSKEHATNTTRGERGDGLTAIGAITQKISSDTTRQITKGTRLVGGGSKRIVEAG